MIDLGTTELFMPGPMLPRGDFEEYSTSLFDRWEQRLQSELPLPDFSLSLEVEEGSVNVAASVAASLYALYLGVGNYGSFISGIEIIGRHIRAAGDYLAREASAPFTRLNIRPRVQRRSGALGRLQRLFRRVQRQELSVENAMVEAEQILKAESATAPEFMVRLADELTQIRRFPQQLILPMELPDEAPGRPDAPRATGQQNQVDRAGKQVAPRSRLRVVVWRESQSGRREVRIIDL